jgi:hypothetical protein
MESILFLLIFLSPILATLLFFLRIRHFNIKQLDEKGWGKCSVCGKAPSTIYNYDFKGITYYHCEEHFWYEHTTPFKKNK